MSKQSLSIANQLYYGRASYGRANNAKRGIPVHLLTLHSFGAPLAASANGVCASQSLTAGVDALINGALASGGVATFATPRNVVAAWTTTSVLTVTGTDQYGETIVESSASGTSFTGKKAFKTITRVRCSISVTGLTVGNGDVLGLPVRVDANGIQARNANGAADAGTFVAADANTATATTGDVRGTYDPAVALNGSNVVSVLLYCADPLNKAAAYGVAQFSG